MSNNNICKNCKYWTKEDKTNLDLLSPIGSTDFRNCDFDIGFCHNPKLVYLGKDEKMEIDGLGYLDDEDYQATLYVEEEFGCIHFKAKEEIDESVLKKAYREGFLNGQESKGFIPKPIPYPRDYLWGTEEAYAWVKGYRDAIEPAQDN